MDENEIIIGGRSINEWREISNIEEDYGTSDEIDNNSNIQEQDPLQSKNTEQETPAKHSEKLSVGDTMLDVAKTTGNEVIRVFLPKKYEPVYEEKTNAAHNVRLLYRYGVSTILAAIPFNVAGKAMIGSAIASKIPALANIVKFNKAANLIKFKKFSNAKKLKNAAGILKAGKAGQIAGEGLLASNAASFAVYRPEEESHFADILPDGILDSLKTNPDDSVSESKWKEVLNNTLLTPVFNFGLHPITSQLSKCMGRLFKNAKKLPSAMNEEEAAETVLKMQADEGIINTLTDNHELYKYVQELRQQAETEGLDIDDLITSKFQGSYIEKAKQINKILADGYEPFFYENGKINITVKKWDETADLTLDEFQEQLKYFDEKRADEFIAKQKLDLDRDLTEVEKEAAYTKYNSSTGIDFQNSAVEDTWKQRGLLGTNDNLIKINENTEKRSENTKAVNSVLKYYKDKWNIKNNIKISFVDGLANGEEGLTRAAKNTGKINKNTKNKIDKQELKIQQLKDKITMLEGGNEEITDPLDTLKEQLRIAKNELKDLQTFLPDIDIKIDINTKNPYSVLRSELEHANDIAHNRVPDKNNINHFSRYQGKNEGEIAPSFVKHKADRKKEILTGEKANDIDNNSDIPVKEKLKDYDFDVISAEKQRYKEGYNPDIDDGYFPDEEYSDLIHMKDKQGRIVAQAYLEFDSDGTIIPTIHNNIEKGAARKIFAYLMSNYPDRKIKWIAKNENSIKSYNHFCEEFPEFAKKLEFENKAKIDNNNTAIYNSEKGVIDGTGNEQNQISGNQNERRGDKGSDNTLSSGSDERPRISETQSNGKGNVSETNPASSKPEQLKLDFTQKTAEEALNDVLSGQKITPDSTANLIEKTIVENAEISGYSWKNIADDAEIEFQKKLEILSDETTPDILRTAFQKGDINAVDMILRRQIAANKVISSLHEEIENLGLNASKEQRRAIIDTIGHINNYVKNIGSAAGRILQGQKLNIRASQTFGQLSLSQAEQDGLYKIADLLSEQVKEYYNLKFTRGEVDLKKLSSSFLKELNENKDIVKIMRESKRRDKDFYKKLDSLIIESCKNGNTSSQISEKLMDLVTDVIYEKAYKTATLAPDKKSWLKTISNYVWNNTSSYYIHNLLSGLGSTARNVMSGGFNTVYYPLKKILAGSCFKGGEELTQEGVLTFQYLRDGIQDSWALAKEAFLKGEGKFSNFTDDAVNSEKAVEEALINFQGLHDWETKNPIEIIQNYHSLMTRVMGASDEFMSQLNYRAVCRAKSVLQAREQAAGLNLSEEEILSNAENIFKSYFDDTLGKPTDFETFNEVKEMLYMNSLSGKSLDVETGDIKQYKPQSFAMKSGENLNRMASQFPPLKICFPFLKAGVNILQMNLEHNPVYLALSKDKREIIQSGGKEGALLKAQAAFGIGSFAFASALAMTGVITGAAPTDQSERKALFATGWKPYSIRVGNKFVSYQGIEPLHTMLGLAADSINIASSLSDSENNDKFNSFLQQGFAAFINNFLDKAAFRTGLKQMQVLTDPEKVVDLERQLTQTAQGFLPDVALVKNFSTFGKRDVKKPRSEYEKIFNNYFNRGLGDYRRDVFGNKQSIINAIISQSSNDNKEQPEYAELEELAKCGYNPTAVKETLDETGLKMKDFINPETNQSAYDAVQEKLTEIEINGQTLQEAVRELVTNPEYKMLDVGNTYDGFNYKQQKVKNKKDEINKIFVLYNNKARQAIIDEYKDNSFVDKNGLTLKEAYERIQQMRIEKLEEYETTEDMLMNF